MVGQMEKFTVSTVSTLIGKVLALSPPVDHRDFASQAAGQGAKFFRPKLSLVSRSRR